MPSSVLSHQGFVLPLKIKYPKKFDGTALCVGSFIPDLLWFASFYKNFSYLVLHSVGGLIYTVPISLLLVIVFDKALLQVAAFFAGKRRLGVVSQLLSFFGVGDYHLLRRKKISLTWLVKATYSVLLGVFSHFLLDLPTHSWIPYLRPFFDGQMPEWFSRVCFKVKIPFHRVVEVPNHEALWFIFSVGFGVLALYCMRYMKKNRLLQRWYRK